VARRWTEKELDYLANHVGIMNYKALARKLNRSEEAVKLCRCRHRMPSFYDGDYYSSSMLAREIGRSRRIIMKYYRRGWLLGKQATWKARFGQRPYLFTEDNIVAFLEGHFQLFDWRKMPNPYFRNIVKGLYDAQKATQDNDRARNETRNREAVRGYQEAGCVY
jgi:hypothetical protein